MKKLWLTLLMLAICSNAWAKIIMDTVGDTLLAQGGTNNAITVSAYGLETTSGTETYKRLGHLAIDSAAPETLYTVPASSSTIVVEMVITNTTASAATISVWHGTAVDADALLRSVSIPANATCTYNGDLSCLPQASGGAETNSLETITTGILSTEIPIGTAANTVVYAPLSGDATMDNAGAVTVADDSHAHTTTTISGVDISADTNLAGDTEVVLTGDALSLAAAVTRDVEWDTIAEINTASTDADVLIFQTVNAPAGTDPVSDAVGDTLNVAVSGIATVTGDSATDTITIGAVEVDGSTTNEIPTEGTMIDVAGQVVSVDLGEMATPQYFFAGTDIAPTITFRNSGTDVTFTFGSGAMTSDGTINAPAMTVTGNTGFKIADSAGGQYLSIIPGTNLTADRTLTLTTGDASRILTIGADSSISGTAYVVGGTDVAFADGGTGLSSWTQYLIPYAATTTSIGQIAIGTSGQVLTSNGAGAAPTFQDATGGGGGSSSAKAYTQMPINGVKLPSTNPARVDNSETNARLLFDATTSQSGFWEMTVPQDYGSSPVVRILYSMASATSGSFFTDVSAMAVTPGDAADINTESYDTVNSCDDATVPGTAGYEDTIACTMTNVDSAAAGDLLKIKIARDVTDTATGDAEIVGVIFEYTKTGTEWNKTLHPDSAILDDNSPPALTIVESSGTGTPRFRVADFDAATDEILYWTFVVPGDMASGNWTADVQWLTNDIGANETCYWDMAISANAETADMTTQAVGTTNSASEDVGAAVNTKIVTTITLSNLDSVAAGDLVTLRFSRDANNVNDDLTSDARLVAINLKIPRT